MSAQETRATVLITGGTSGLGRATALLLAQHGYRVFAAGRSAERRAALEAVARERNLPVEALEMNVCDDASVARAVDEARACGGPIDVLVNSAGLAYIAAMEEISLAHLRHQFETNFFGAVRVIQRVLPEMRERRRGRIVNMSSVAGRLVIPLYGPYSGSKFALEGMSDALRLELHPFGIYVVLIEPGYIPTGFVNASVELSAPYAARAKESPYAMLYSSFRRKWKEHTGKPRYTAEDCARVVLRALRETPPKPRYGVTRSAQTVNFAKRLLSDRLIDRGVLRAFGLDQDAPGKPSK